jgi:hypothetical protein
MPQNKRELSELRRLGLLGVWLMERFWELIENVVAIAFWFSR